jgi:hypothetical protein
LTIAGAQAPYGNFPIPAAASGGQPGGPVAALRSQFASGAQIGVTFDTGLTWTQFVTIASAAAPGNFEVWVFWNGFVLADQTGVMLLLSWATSVSS